MIDFEALRSCTVTTDPFTFLAVDGILPPEQLAAVNRDFPAIAGTGIHPAQSLDYGPAFAQLLDDLRSPGFEGIMSSLLGIDLEGRPLMTTVRGFCHRRDGRIHTDSKDKIATVLLYLNEGWDASSGSRGQLRLLRSGDDLEDVICEIPPRGGTLVAFRRSENSWHGHHPFEGQRRYIMCNWLTSQTAFAGHVGRHSLSATVKRLAGNSWIGGGRWTN